MTRDQLTPWDIFAAMFHAMVERKWEAVIAGCELLKEALADTEAK